MPIDRIGVKSSEKLATVVEGSDRFDDINKRLFIEVTVLLKLNFFERVVAHSIETILVRQLVGATMFPKLYGTPKQGVSIQLMSPPSGNTNQYQVNQGSS